MENFLRVRKFANGAPTLIEIIHNYTLNMNEWYTMGVRAKGRTFEWYINKELVLSFTDNDSNYIQEAEFRVNAYNVSAMIDDVEIAEVNSIDFQKKTHQFKNRRHSKFATLTHSTSPHRHINTQETQK